MMTAIYKLTGRDETKFMAVQVKATSDALTVQHRLIDLYKHKTPKVRVELMLVSELSTYTMGEAMTEPHLVTVL